MDNSEWFWTSKLRHLFEHGMVTYVVIETCSLRGVVRQPLSKTKCVAVSDSVAGQPVRSVKVMQQNCLGSDQNKPSGPSWLVLTLNQLWLHTWHKRTHADACWSAWCCFTGGKASLSVLWDSVTHSFGSIGSFTWSSCDERESDMSEWGVRKPLCEKG